MQKFVNPMRSSALQTLQDVHHGKRPAVFVAERLEEQVHMIRHNHNRMKMDCLRMFAEAMAENQVASLFEEWNSRAGAESNEQIRISLLQVRKPPSIPVFGERYRSEGHVWGGRPRPPKYAAYPGRAFLSVTDEHARFGPERSCLADAGSRGRGRPRHTVWESFDSAQGKLRRCRHK